MSNKIPGYFISAIGEIHVLMAHNFALTLRVNEDTRPICLLVKPEHVRFVRDLDYIDFVIPFEEKDDYAPMTDHEKWCGMAKIDFHDNIPMDHYLMIDADFLCCGPTSHVWDLLDTIDQPVVNFGTRDAPYWHWNELPNIEAKVGTKLSYTCGDIVYFDKTHKDFKDYIARVREVFVHKYDEYGCKRLFGDKQSKTEEIAFSIASGERGYVPVEMADFPVVNYNPQPKDSYNYFNYPFESLAQEKNRMFDIRPPFLHMWDKYFGMNYQRVFFEIALGIVKRFSDTLTHESVAQGSHAPTTEPNNEQT